MPVWARAERIFENADGGELENDFVAKANAAPDVAAPAPPQVEAAAPAPPQVEAEVVNDDAAAAEEEED